MYVSPVCLRIEVIPGTVGNVLLELPNTSEIHMLVNMRCIFPYICVYFDCVWKLRTFPVPPVFTSFLKNTGVTSNYFVLLPPAFLQRFPRLLFSGTFCRRDYIEENIRYSSGRSINLDFSGKKLSISLELARTAPVSRVCPRRDAYISLIVRKYLI